MIRWIERLDDIFAGIALFICFALVCYQVGGRAWGASVSWTDELSRYLIIVSTYFGASAAIRTRDHIRVELLVDMLPAGLRRAVETLVILMCAGYTATVAFVGYRWLEDTISLGLVSAESSLAIPIYWFQAVVPLGFALMTLRLLAQAWAVARNERSVPLADAPIPQH
jgi:C4-dicarboxylate transporter DctQ subunit